jgi:hypothetical protein
VLGLQPVDHLAHLLLQLQGPGLSGALVSVGACLNRATLAVEEEVSWV